MSLEDCVNYFIKQDLTGEEIEKLTGKPVVLYSDLAKYKTISQLLGKEKAVVILYQTSSRTSGHFICICEDDEGNVKYCDSYALNPDNELQFTPYDKPLPKYLVKLLGDNYTSNPFEYQSKKPNVSVCGRYASLFFLWRNLSFLQIREILKHNKDVYLQDSDNVVCLLTLVGLSEIREFYSKISRGNR